ncbi:hypothetical protein Lal_00034917 [Lupinus albus]|nr:hypothetical protein Lal_00034917 [Lupinus albus]
MVVNGDALLPILIDEDTLTVGGAISAHVALTINLVFVDPMVNEHSRGNEKDTKGSITPPPRKQDVHVSKNAKVSSGIVLKNLSALVKLKKYMNIIG